MGLAGNDASDYLVHYSGTIGSCGRKLENSWMVFLEIFPMDGIHSRNKPLAAIRLQESVMLIGLTPGFGAWKGLLVYHLPDALYIYVASIQQLLGGSSVVLPG